MKSYEININSNLRAIPVAIIFFGLSFYLMTLIPRDWPDLVKFGIIAVLFFSPVIPVTILSRGRIRIDLTEEAFRFIWIKRFFLSKESNIELGWDRIIDYVNQEDRGLDSFRLTITNNQQLKFYRYTYFPQTDDFDKFLTQFPKFIKTVDLANERTIEQGKTEFQTRSFKRVLAVLTILAVGLLVNTLLNPDSGTRWASLGVIFLGILFYWMQATRKY
ncbi:hypothetical protein JKA74_09900 [Marivirga sp. S37H4]|uniref:Uncharacterized protein n=1 Tax=Marivirga aurantiaca TaxID=2802615 RepID=A0A934WYX1_9BACT|nr:hypothetical protein [Marivirga aurantiaca]MBK6265351.1 hypothetical protein [Marivirga aurantiaca]